MKPGQELRMINLLRVFNGVMGGQITINNMSEDDHEDFNEAIELGLLIDLEKEGYLPGSYHLTEEGFKFMAKHQACRESNQGSVFKGWW